MKIGVKFSSLLARNKTKLMKLFLLDIMRPNCMNVIPVYIIISKIVGII